MYQGVSDHVGRVAHRRHGLRRTRAQRLRHPALLRLSSLTTLLSAAAVAAAAHFDPEDAAFRALLEALAPVLTTVVAEDRLRPTSADGAVRVGFRFRLTAG